MTKMMLLDIEQDFDFSLIAICSPLPDYRLSYNLNKQEGMHFVQRKTDVNEVLTKDKLAYSFSIYDSVHHNESLHYSLLSNQSWEISKSVTDNLGGLFQLESFDSKPYLIPEHRQADFFLLIYGEVNTADKIKFLSSLKKVLGVVAAYELEVEAVRSKEKLLHLKDDYE
jgi:hypothetical protein